MVPLLRFKALWPGLEGKTLGTPTETVFFLTACQVRGLEMGRFHFLSDVGAGGVWKDPTMPE